MSNDLQCGKLLGVPNAEYHAAEAVTSTRLRTFIKNPFRFHQRYIAKTLAGKSSYALDLGQAFHALCESQSAFDSLAVQSPFKDFRTNEAKAWRDEANKKHVIITAEERAQIYAMYASVCAHPVANVLIADTEAEVTWRAKLGRFYVQARTDRWSEKGCAITNGQPYFVDFKKVDSLEDDDFEADASRYDYHVQMVWYQEVLATVLGLDKDAPRPRCFIVATEFEPPHETCVYEWDGDALKAAKADVLTGIRNLRHCYETDTWPGLSKDIRTLRLKYWKVKEIADRIESAPQNILTA